MHAAPLIDPDLPLTEMMRLWPQTRSVFIAHGMLCVGCLIGPFHTIEDACAEYRLDPAQLYAELQAAVRSGAAPEGPADAVG